MWKCVVPWKTANDMHCKCMVINLLKNAKKWESLSCTRKTTPAVFGIRLIQHPAPWKKEGSVLRTSQSFLSFSKSSDSYRSAANCLLTRTVNRNRVDKRCHRHRCSICANSRDKKICNRWAPLQSKGLSSSFSLSSITPLMAWFLKVYFKT